MRGTSVRGTPYIHKSGAAEGQSAGKPQGYDGTQGPQYQRDIIDTRGRGGTPYQSQDGNPATARRVVSADLYGKVMSNQQGNANDPMNTGAGVLFGSMGPADSPPGAASLDSPVPTGSPVFDPDTMIAENRAHLGSGNEMGMRDLINGGGVMSRGMEGVDKSGDAEDSLTRDDTLPGVAPRR